LHSVRGRKKSGTEVTNFCMISRRLNDMLFLSVRCTISCTICKKIACSCNSQSDINFNRPPARKHVSKKIDRELYCATP
jgi:hypothetical protein